MGSRALRRGLFRPGDELLLHARPCFVLVWFPWGLPLPPMLLVLPVLPLSRVLCCCSCRRCALRRPRFWPPERSRLL